MAKADLSQFGLDRAESGDDVVVPFTLDELDCRGRSVRLANSIDLILSRHNYPDPVARLLAEATTLAALIGSSLKFDGRFILQTQTDGPIDMIVVDFDAPDGMRGYARFDRAAINKAIAAKTLDAGTLLGNGHLAMTIDQGVHTDRYQGIVKLDGIGLEEAARHYFMQSEQIPTEVRLAVAEHAEKGSTRTHWRAGGLLLQFFPKAGEHVFPDLPGDGDFDNPDMADPHYSELDRWSEAKALFSTLSDAEMVDPGLSAERLLFRLFHERGVRVFAPQPLEERCRCSADRIEAMLAESFNSEERAEMAVEGQIEVVCEFCSTAYHFNPHQFESKN
ncbi:MAG: Hsp33 family molecular chaperone [Hyphomicrobiaceae bacterium]|nr:Hsp33 family molecular chaperone [Hyphomicrobiaceae bacterium]MCC0022630.1 Hsp33 family molecular chaperone [Hyphomicrobiaceae bacterium]